MIETKPRTLAIAAAVIKTLPLVATLVVLAPVQAIANLLGWRALAGRLPVVFHKVALWCLGVEVRLEGANLAPGPALMVGNHISWLDIVILGSLAPARFISKDDVASWPVFGTLGRLQRTLFISRTRRTQTSENMRHMGKALDQGERLILFAEGTSSDGGRVLPFRSALFGAVMDPEDAATQKTRVQTFTIAYLRRNGLPINRSERAALGWYGDLDLLPSLLDIIHGGPLRVSLVLGEPVSPQALGPRKHAAKTLQTQVRQTLASRLRAG